MKKQKTKKFNVSKEELKQWHKSLAKRREEADKIAYGACLDAWEKIHGIKEVKLEEEELDKK